MIWGIVSTVLALIFLGLTLLLRDSVLKLALKVAVLQVEAKGLGRENARSNERMEIQRGAVERAGTAHKEIEADLREQVQDLAEKLSTLALQGATPVVHKFEGKPKPPKPYSQALQNFLNALEFAGAREMVEEDVERLRGGDKPLDDEQILQIVSKAEND